jgi:hypothetical protein
MAAHSSTCSYQKPSVVDNRGYLMNSSMMPMKFWRKKVIFVIVAWVHGVMLMVVEMHGSSIMKMTRTMDYKITLATNARIIFVPSMIA